jgi:hypothetical protein
MLCLSYFFILVPIYAGELYETEEYLSAINVDNPYDSGGPTVGTPDGSPPSGGSPFSPTDDPVSDVGPSSGGGDSSGSYGGGNFNQSFGFGTISGSWTTGTQNQNTTTTQDYLTQALFRNTGVFVFYRSRGKRHAKTAETNCVGDVQTVSIISRRVRKIRDEQIVYQKIQRAIKTSFARCYQTTIISDTCTFDGFTISVFEISDIKAATMFCLSA